MVSLEPDHGLEPYYRRELLEQWRQSSRAQRRRGRAWYSTAREMLAELARETGYSVEQAVAVLAITSPGAQLTTNLSWTRQALESHGAAKVGRFPNAMRPKIRAALADPAAAHEWAIGPKVGPFHRAILGDDSCLVLDRWALFAAQGHGSDRDSNHQLTKSVRAAIEQAYRSAARRARCKVRDFQATVWIHVRETTPHAKDGVVHRLQDITN